MTSVKTDKKETGCNAPLDHHGTSSLCGRLDFRMRSMSPSLSHNIYSQIILCLDLSVFLFLFFVFHTDAFSIRT